MKILHLDLGLFVHFRIETIARPFARSGIRICSGRHGILAGAIGPSARYIIEWV